MKVAIACIVKNEFDYLLEWIAYHRRVIGVCDFIIADNVSDDGTTQLLEALHNTKLVQRIHFPRINREKGIQAVAYDHILKEYGSSYDFIAFIDADEFIVNNSNQKFTSLLKSIGSKRDCGAIGLNWRVFGSSGNYYQTNRLVIERFIWASRKSHGVNHHIKSIVKPKYVKTMHIHHASLKNGKKYRGTKGELAFIKSIKDKEYVPEGGSAPFTKLIDNSEIYIAHYVVKSKNEHMVKKAARGSAAGNANRQKGMGYFKGHDLNQEFNEDLYKHRDVVKDEIRLLENEIEKKAYFLLPLRTHIDRIDSKLIGWVGLEEGRNTRIKVLNDDLTEEVYELNMNRSDVCKAGLSKVLKCGFSIDLSGKKLENITIWVEGSNAILWDGSKGY